LGALSDILDLLVSAKKDAQILGRIDLREEMSRLGRTVIEVIPQLVKVLNGAHQNTGAEETTGRKRHAFANRLAGMKRVFRPLPEFEKTTLASAIESMNKGKERWNETVERSGLSYTVATFEMTASTYNNVKAIQKAVSEHTAEVTHLGVEVRALRDEMANYQAGLTTHKPEVSPAVVPVINYFTVIVADDEMKRSFIREQQNISKDG
jgi:regulator of replication initiation timing